MEGDANDRDHRTNDTAHRQLLPDFALGARQNITDLTLPVQAVLPLFVSGARVECRGTKDRGLRTQDPRPGTESVQENGGDP